MIKKIFIVSLLLFSVATNASAGQYNNLIIENITIMSPGIARITGSGGNMVRETSCSTKQDYAQFTFDVTTSLGKSWQSLILTALVSGKKVHIIGNNSCLNWGHLSYEAVRTIYILKS